MPFRILQERPVLRILLLGNWLPDWGCFRRSRPYQCLTRIMQSSSGSLRDHGVATSIVLLLLRMKTTDFRLWSKAGQVPYSVHQVNPTRWEIGAVDITAAVNPHSASNNFTQRRIEQFDAAHGWPHKRGIFTITLHDVPSVQGHLLRYYATLISANHVVSFVESPIFLLYWIWGGRWPEV
jgi:hypothetical protein